MFYHHRFNVMRAGGEFHVIDHATGGLGVIGSPATGRLAEYAAVIDPAADDAAWKWEQAVNAYPAETLAILAAQLSTTV